VHVGSRGKAALSEAFNQFSYVQRSNERAINMTIKMLTLRARFEKVHSGL